MAYDNFLIDKRVVERNIAKGLVDADELKRHIEGLPDRESNCVHVSLDGSTAQAESSVGVADDVADDDVEDVDDDELDDEDDEEDDDDEDEEVPSSEPSPSEG
jgi:hypothetical protein